MTEIIFRTIIIIILILTPKSVFSEQMVTESITLEKAQKLALENSPYLKAIEHEKNTYATYSEEAKSYRLPNVDVMTGYIKTNSPGDVFGLQLSQEKFSLMDFMVKDPNHPAPYEDYFTTLQVSQILYAGGQIKHGVKQGSAMNEAGQFRYDRALRQVRFNTVKAYLDVLLSEKYVELMEHVVNTVKAHVNQAKNYYEQGFIMEADFLQAQVILSEMERKKLSAENNHLLAKAFLNNVIGVDQNINYTFENNFKFSEVNLSLDGLIIYALENRSDFKEMKKKVEAAGYQINIEKSENKPKVMLVGEINYHDESLLGSDAKSYKLMAIAKYNLFNGKRTRSKVKRAKEQFETYTNYMKQMEEGIQLQVKQAVFNVEDASKQYKAANIAETQAAKNLQLREERFKSGVEKTTDLLSADTEYVKASTSKLHALFNYHKALEALKFMSEKDQINE